MSSKEKQHLFAAQAKVNYDDYRQASLASAITYGNFLAGAAVGFSGPAGQQLQLPSSSNIYGKEFTLTLQEVSWMTSVMAIGTLFGSIFAGFLFEQTGRKKNSIYIVGLTFLLGNLVITLSSSAIILIIGRILVGFGSGVQISTVSVYLLETTRKEFRSRIIGYIMVWQNLGILFSFSLSIWLEWMYIALATGICVLLFMIFVAIFSVESPVWLLKKNRKSEAIKSLHWICHNDDEESIQVLLETIVRPLAFGGEEQSNVTWSDIKFNWKPICIATIFNCAFMTVGEKSIMAYINTILTLLNVNQDDINFIAFIIGFGQLIASILSIPISKQCNRKPQIIFSTWAMVIFLAILSALSFLIDSSTSTYMPSYLKWLPSLILFCYCFVGDLGMISLCWPVTTEILPPQIRPHLNSTVTAVSNIVSFITLKTFVELLSSFDLYGTLLFYAILCALTAIFVYVFVPETKQSI